jgi:hypothetical protein
MTERDPEKIGEPWKIVSEKNMVDIVDSLHRISVPGGFIYRSTIVTKLGVTQSMCFVPGDCQ